MKIALIILFGCFILNPSISQDYRSDVITPNGSIVKAWITAETSVSIREYNDFYWSSRYPNAEVIITFDNLSSTRRFNCHGYAWHMSELAYPLSQPRWIGYEIANTDEYIYWEDGSYINVPVETYPGKVSWASGDHSAITTSEQGWFISKWNELPLMKHRWNDSPYGTYNLKYYKRNVPVLSIQGSSTICDQESYSINYSPDGSTIEWTVSPNIAILSGQGTSSIVATKSPTGGFGNGYINVKIKLNGVIVLTATKAIDYVGTPVATSVTGPSNLSVNGSGTFTAEPYISNSDIEYRWIISPSTVTTSPWNNSNYITFHAEGAYSVSCQIVSLCGFGSAANTLVNVTRSGYFNLFPNPATDVVTVDIVGEIYPDNVNEGNSLRGQLYEIEIWDEYVMVKQFTTDQRVSQISVSDLSAGEYLVKVSVNGQVYTQTLIKK